MNKPKIRESDRTKYREGNELIARFMGTYSFFKWIHYHNSWDWLIPVIDKITDMDEYSSHYRPEMSSMFSDGSIQINTKFIENTYEQVVEFINWYNERSK